MARILVMEDDDTVRSFLRDFLEFEGYEVTEAPDGDMGCRLFREAPADLVILDLVMPGKSGLAAIREIREDFPGARIIAISGGAGEGGVRTLDDAREAGAVEAFAKPFNLDEFLVAVRHSLAA